MSYKGRYKPKHPEKYLGDCSEITFRSLWERKVMIFFDDCPSIIKWSSEPFAIPYVSPLDNKVHKYYPDFYLKVKNREGSIIDHVVEIKPKYQSRMPKQSEGKSNRTFVNEAATYAVNEAKWTAARQACKVRNWNFAVWTEDEIFGKKK